MNEKIKIINGLVIFAVFLIVLACSQNDQQAEANKLVGDANKKIGEAKELLDKTEQRNKTLFGANIQTKQELAEYKTQKNTEAKSIVGDYEKVSETLKEISKLFDEVSRMNVHEKYKEYAKLKSDEFATRAEAVAVRKGNAQAFIEIDDHQKMTAKFDENNTKSDRLFTEADEIAAKARRMEDENKTLFVDLNN